MAVLTRSTKIWAIISLVSLFVYNAWLVRGSYAILIGWLTGVPSDVWYVEFTGTVFWAGHIGLTARLVALLFGFAAFFLLWAKGRTFLRVKYLVAAALFLEGVNFVGLIPSLPFLFEPNMVTFSPSLGVGYLLQIVFTLPFLWALAFKVVKYKEPSQRLSLLKVAAVTCAAYTVALFANAVSRWASMISVSTVGFLFEGIHSVGFVNAVVVMPFSVVFALAAAALVFEQKENSAIQWLGASLFVVGLNYAIYLIYSYFANSLNFAPLVDIWTVPLLGLGVALLLNSRKPRNG